MFDHHFGEITDSSPLSLTLLHSSDNGGKIVVQQDHVCGVLGSVGPCDPHGDTNISLLKSRRVVHTITCHSDDRALGG